MLLTRKVWRKAGNLSRSVVSRAVLFNTSGFDVCLLILRIPHVGLIKTQYQTINVAPLPINYYYRCLGIL